ncbi:MAG TPA: tRNA lysidine(34) synthetase TilS [Candidatus Moranbacteria bacterium]|nr:tRNA lysidine(34) synthetase TilS [Candidatus Moranbacteria bacterium]
MPNLIKKVQNTIFEHNLFPHGSKIILACSGGPDSSALLDILSKLRKKYDLELVIAHVNYSLRENDSKRDEKFVTNLSEKYDLKLFALNPKVGKISEDSLRKIRYDFFEKIRRELNFNFIAVGHTLDDQVETFLMRIIRGSGLAGLSAISYKNNAIIRPLLNISKAEILNYLKKNKLSYRIDRTNLESDYLRNKIRNQLIPILEKNYNPKVKTTIFNSIKSIQEDFDFLEKISNKEFKKNKNLSVKSILSVHPSLQKRLLLLAIAESKNSLKNISSSHIRELLKILKSTKSKGQIVVFQGLKITRKGDKLTIEKI